MNNIHLVAANIADAALLARMNKELIEDEGSENPMTLTELEARMRDFLAGDYVADLLMAGEKVVGYALYRFVEPNSSHDVHEVYLRQYMIVRNARGCGFGLQGIELLMATRFHDVAKIKLDVLSVNGPGWRFWEKAGFLPYSVQMQRKPIIEQFNNGK